MERFLHRVEILRAIMAAQYKAIPIQSVDLK